jgi:hypothetical protein
MKVLPALLLVCGLGVMLPACARTDPPASALPTPAPTPAKPAAVGKDAGALPDAPKADAKNELKPLNPDKSLLLELAPDPANPAKKKAVRVLVACEVCLREGPLEVFLCKKGTKEHEAILRTSVDARFIHAALIAAGGKPGHPVQFVNPKTGEEDYKPATGSVVKVTVYYTKDGKLASNPAQDWIRDQKTKKPMAHQWVFAGSRFMQNPDKPDAPPYYCANNGEVIAISNFVDSMLDLPVSVSSENAALAFDAMTDKIPPLLSKVWVVLEPVPEKK